MHFWCHDGHPFPLPPRHRFPLGKLRRLRERLVASAVVRVDELATARPAPWETLAWVHDEAYLARVREGSLSDREQRVLGLPWSVELVERARRSAQATVEAARDAATCGWGMNLGGGTHHAGFAAGRGYCVFNDVALAVAAVRAEGLARRVLVVDCDVHQGDGTAELLAGDAEAFTLSVQGGANYPFQRATSDLDVDLPTGTGDDAYLSALSAALDRAVPAAAPELVLYLAGADPWEGDRLGRLAVTKRGLHERDRLVLDRAAGAGAAVCVTLAGGYAPGLEDTVDINAATVAEVAARARRSTVRHASGAWC